MTCRHAQRGTKACRCMTRDTTSYRQGCIAPKRGRKIAVFHRLPQLAPMLLLSRHIK